MGRRNQEVSGCEFPVLKELGLYASSTKGDGNCLFRALSDQIFGDESHHFEIRKNVVDYTRSNEEHFSAFVGEFGETFDQYVNRLYQDGVYGGHIEIVSFADSYGAPVVIYQAETLYVVEPQSVPKESWKQPVHIAYHTWEHYSSVRKEGAPKCGPANSSIGFPKLPDVTRGSNTSNDGGPSSEVPGWKVDIVMRSVPDASEEEVKKLLETKDYGQVIEELIMKVYEDDEGKDGTMEDNVAPHAEQPSDNPTQPSIEKVENVSTSKNKGRESWQPPASRKKKARERRLEKKERTREKKSRARRDSNVSKETIADKDDTSTLKRIIHI